MAKRSDFAQKLLDDLRLRKERMATTSQSSNRSNSMAIIDAYSYAKQNYRGSKDVRTNDMIGSRTGSARYKSTGSSRSSIGGESAKQIVSYGRGRGSEQFGDLSMALTFAIENAGKLGRTDSSTRSSMLGFLQQIGRRSSVSSADRHRPSTSQFPAFSPIQIEEISKGAMKLNQILRACSNGVNIDRYSIEIGKELLKGAIDLENSLKMLLNLQEASEYMVSPQKKKNRIKLLEEGEEEDDDSTANIAEEWKLDLPRFSFDKPSRKNIQEFGRSGHKQRLPALTNSTEHSNFNHDNQLVTASRSSSHRRSISYSSNVKTPSALSESKNRQTSSDSKSEKARIPNVIAKLMGLDKLPESENSTSTTQKNSSSKPKEERETFRRATQEEATKIVRHKAKEVENLAPPKKQKVVEANKNPVVQNTSYVVYKERNVPAHLNFEVVIDNEKSSWENSQGNKAVMRSEKAMVRKEDVVQLRQNTSRMENKKQSSTSQKKSQSNLEHQQPFVPRKSVPEEREHSAKQILLGRKQKGSEIMSKSSSKPVRDGINLQQKQPHSNQEKLNKKSLKKASNAIQTEWYPNGKVQVDDLVRERSSAELKVDTDSNNWNPDQNLSPRVQESESVKEKPRVPPVMDEKAVQIPIIQKSKVARVHKNESPRRIDVVVARRNGTLSNMARPLRHQNSILKEVKSRRVEKLRDIKPEEAEPRIIKSSRSTVNHQLKDLTQEVLKEEVDNTYTLNTSNKDEHKSLREPESLASNDSCQNVTPITEEDQAPFCEDQEPKSGGDVPIELIGTHNDQEITEISLQPQVKQENTIKIIKTSKQIFEPLTESENQLKQILVKSQLFLNTAEALFKLDIPIDVLNADGHDHQDNNEDRKLILDCGYELMRRKGRKQELALHPCVKISITFVKITTFDGLVKQLSKDFDKLRSYGRNGVEDSDVDHEYLPRMLESDVYNKDPHVNCMWDLGWNEDIFAFIEIDEVVRDVEKHLLNGLLDDITGDLFLQMSFSSH